MAGFKKIAHRGASGRYPENTRLAFIKAIEAGADMIELDCQLSRDGHVVVFHDEQLRRTAGVRGTLRSKTLAQLKSLDIGRWRNKSCRGEAYPHARRSAGSFRRQGRSLSRDKKLPEVIAGYRAQSALHLEPLRLSGSHHRVILRLSQFGAHPGARSRYCHRADFWCGGQAGSLRSGQAAWRRLRSMSRRVSRRANFYRRRGRKGWMFTSGPSTSCATSKPLFRWACRA